MKEYLGSNIEFKMIDGHVYANANSMADRVKLDNWKRSPNTKRYIQALETKGVENYVKSTEYIFSEEGRNGGTWIHEKLILSLARFIDVNFELWADEQISTLIREGQVVFNKDSYMILDPVERATRWIEEEQVRQQLSLDLSVAKPKADFVDATFNPSQGSILMRDFAKLIYDKDTLDIGEKKLYDILRQKKIVTLANTPMQKYIEMGIFEMKNTSNKTNKLIVYVTNKGQTYLYNKITKNI